MSAFAGGTVMRILVFLAAAMIGAAAHAETNVFYAERGHWSVAIGGSACRAFNRPLTDFNASPYNGLAIVTRAGAEIGVEVYFWPQAIDPSRNNRLRLDFTAADTITLDAKGTDFMLAATDEAGKLWRFFQTAKTVRAVVADAPKLELFFGLDDINWVLDNLQRCAGLLPKQ